MVREKKTKITQYIKFITESDEHNRCKAVTVMIAMASLILMLFPLNTSAVAMYPGCNIINRFSFSFFHASLFHCLTNILCFFTIIYAYNISLRQLILAIIIAATFPVTITANPTPVIGLSAICFALMGYTSIRATRKFYYHTWALAFIAAGFCLTNISAIIHLYAYAVATLIAHIKWYLQKRYKR